MLARLGDEGRAATVAVFGDLHRNLLAGLRLSVFLPVKADAFRSTVGQAISLALLSFLLFLSQGYLLTVEPRAFHAEGLWSFAAIMFVYVVAIALRGVAAAEVSLGFEPSEPQIHVGSEIRPKLEALERRLEGLANIAADSGGKAPDLLPN